MNSCPQCGFITDDPFSLILHRFEIHSKGLSVTDKKRRYMYECAIKKKRRLVEKKIIVQIPDNCELELKKVRGDVLVVKLIKT